WIGLTGLFVGILTHGTFLSCAVQICVFVSIPSNAVHSLLYGVPLPTDAACVFNNIFIVRNYTLMGFSPMKRTLICMLVVSCSNLNVTLEHFYPFVIAKGKGKARAVTIHVNSGSPCKRLVVFPSIVMVITIHMRYEERNLYKVLVREVKNMTNTGSSCLWASLVLWDPAAALAASTHWKTNLGLGPPPALSRDQR
ncbi:unnamed protein product, partial [Prunus brigantina]